MTRSNGSARSPWCDGNIGMFGVSYPGLTQTQSAPLRSPYVKGIVPIASQQDNFGHRPGGALGLHASPLLWHHRR